jgi:DNA-binding response OmpR family regulator
MGGHVEGPLNVLLVEDNEVQAAFYARMLAESDWTDYRVDTAGTLTDALGRLAVLGYDVIIADLGLPESSGWETFAAIHEKHPLVPIVVLTSEQDNKLALRILKNGAQDYLFKSEITPQYLLRTVRYAIERGKLRRELVGALDRIQHLEGLLPICSSCKKVRDEEGIWEQIEKYLAEHVDAHFTHTLCPDCIKRLYPELADEEG